MNPSAFGSAVAASILLPAASHAQFFLVSELFDTSPFDQVVIRSVSADGRVIAGTTGITITPSVLQPDGTIIPSEVEGRGFVWSAAGGFTEIPAFEVVPDIPGYLDPATATPFSSVTALSGDGSTVGGVSNGIAFRWTEAGGLEALTTGADGPAIVNDLSFDGSVAVGSTNSFATIPGAPDPLPTDDEGFLWREGEGLTRFTELGPVPERTLGVGISDDGQTIVGLELGPTGSGFDANLRYFRTGDAGGIEVVDFASTPASAGDVLDVSDDGSTLVGSAINEAGTVLDAFRFTTDGGFESLTEDVLAGADSVVAFAQVVSPDGSVVIGQYSAVFGALTGDVETREGDFIWTEDRGFRDFDEFVTGDLGIDLPDLDLRVFEISSDNRTLIGVASTLGDELIVESFVLRIPAPGAAAGLLVCFGGMRRRHRTGAVC